MRLALNGQLVSEQPDAATITQSLRNAIADEVFEFALLEHSKSQFVQTASYPDKDFVVEYHDGPAGEHLSCVTSDVQAIIDVFVLCLHRDPRWRTAVRWTRMDSQTAASAWTPAKFGVLFGTVLVIGFAGLAFALWMSSRTVGRVDLSETMPAILAIAGFAGYITWLAVFFASIRPRVARGLGQRLGVTIREEFLEGHWEVVERGRGAAGCLIFVVDVSLLLLAGVGPFAVALLAFFLAFR